MRYLALVALFVFACSTKPSPNDVVTPHPIAPHTDSDELVDTPEESDVLIDSDTDSVVVHSDSDTDTTTTAPSAPVLNPGYVDITPAEVAASLAWSSTAFVSDYPIAVIDLDGDCTPAVGSSDCTGWTCKRPANCTYEVLFQAQRMNNGTPTEEGLVYSYNPATQLWDIPAFMSSLSDSGLANTSSYSQYYGLLRLFTSSSAVTFTDGVGTWEYDGATWHRAASLDPGPCGARNNIVLSFGDFDRDGWLDILQPANDHVIEESPSSPSITVTCHQGPVLLQTQTPDHHWLYHNAFPEDGDADQADDYHDTYAFVNTWSNGSFQVLAMGRPRPNQGGTASGWWAEVGEDANGFPVAEQQEFVSSAFTQLHPMGGDYVWYYNAARWDSILVATTNSSYITAALSIGGVWFEYGEMLGLRIPHPIGGLPDSGTWGALQADPDKNGISDLLVNNIDSNPGTPSGAPYLMAWYRTGSGTQDQFIEWPEGTLGDLNLRRGGKGGRSMALFDIDSDGDNDLLDVGADATPRFLRNDIPGHAISVSLVGHTSNAMGIGSIIELTLPNGFKQRRTVGSAWNPSTAVPPNYEFGLAEFSEASVMVYWHSGITIDYGTLEHNQAYVLYEPPLITFSDSDRLMTSGSAQVITMCPYAQNGTLSLSTQVEFAVTNVDGARAVVNSTRLNSNGCYDATLRAGSSSGSAKIQVFTIQNGVRTMLNVQPRIWIGSNPGYIADWE